jgi:3'(2'), 5'-bisphosphate nucleotidase
MKYSTELATARSIATDAASLVRSYVGQTIAVERKPGNEPVTEADRRANELIVTRLQAAFPNDAILSEELPDDGSRFDRSRVWMIDPIDGTRDFIHGDSGYAVMVGLCVDGRPQLGVVVEPSRGVTFVGVVGTGAWQEDAAGARTPLATSTLAAPPGVRLVASKSHRTGDIDDFRRMLGIQDEINVGSVGVKVAMVADGRRDLYVYPGARTKIWDTCAPEAILLAAGGRLTDSRGQALIYTGDDLNNHFGIVASNGPLHDRVLAALADLRRMSRGGD